MFEIHEKIIELITVEQSNRTRFVPFLYGWTLDSGQSLYFGNPDPSHSLYLSILLGKNLGVIVLNHFWLTAAYIEDHIKRKVMRRGVLSS
jgi:hypothetical protein